MNRLSESGAIAGSKELWTCRAAVAPLPRTAPPRPDGRASLSPDPASPAAWDPRGCSSPFPRRASLRRGLRPRENAATLLRGARAPALALAALAVLALAVPELAAAQTVTLVSNTGQADASDRSPGLFDYAQPFNTGSNSGGYNLAGIVLDFGAAPTGTGTLTITVRENSSGNPSGTVLYTLTNPTFLAGLNEFLAPLNAELVANTRYWVMASYSADSGGPDWERTQRSNGLDTGAAAGWAIDGSHRFATRGSTVWTGSGSILFQIAVKGSATPNNAPVFADATASRSFTETVGDAAVTLQGEVGAVVTATDADDDSLTYTLEGTDAAKFYIVEDTGQIRTDFNQKYDREAKASYSVTVKADDGNGGTDTIAVTISVDNAVEKPVAPAIPTVTATSGSTTSLDVSWMAPANTGRPAITGYKVEYRAGVSGNWLTHAHTGTGTTATIASLTAATSYQVQVLAVNSDGDGAWSGPGSGTTGTATSTAATGKPGITGTAQVGWTLTATVGTIADVDGLPDPFFPSSNATTTVQWIQVDGVNESDISGATSTTYTLVTADAGKKIKVKVSFEDEGGNDEGPLTSDAYPSSGTVQASGTPVSGVLVSNVGQGGSHYTSLSLNDLAQRFTTGTNATGYTLTSIELTLNSDNSTNTPTVKLHSASATGTEVATLTGPSMLGSGAGNYTFTPSSTVTLRRLTSYWVVAEGDAGWETTIASEDATPAMGWEIGDYAEFRTPSSTGSFASTNSPTPLKIRVNGTFGGVVLSNDATLSALALEDASDDSAIAISPVFASGTTSYTASVVNGVDEITIEPTVNESSATVEYLDSSDTPIADADSGKAGQQVSLSEDANTIKVKVTAQDTTTTNTYTVVVTRAAVVPGSTDALVSNVGQDRFDSAGLDVSDFAQSFTTGANATGYTLRSIELNLDSRGAGGSTSTPTVKLFSGSANGTEVSTFIGPAMLDASSVKNYAFTPTLPVILGMSTTYWVVAEGDTDLTWTDSASEDATPAPGWEIGDDSESRDASSTGIFTPVVGYPLKIRVNGTTVAAPTNTPPTAADKTVTIGSDTAYTFAAEDFGFDDADTADMLASVRIESLPALGELALNDTAVSLSDVIPRADIDGNNLTFTPVAGASGDAYASFTFKVNDGTEFSADPNTITFNVRDLTCAAPNFAGDNRRELWTGMVTVGDINSAAYGFHADESLGALDDTTFAIGRNSYTVDIAFVQSTTSSAGRLSFGLSGGVNGNLTAGEVAALRLHVCDTTVYDFSAATLSSNTYLWAGSLDWSPPVATRTLYLSLPANNDAMGAPTITGTAQAGQELSADVTGITDADGLTGDLSTPTDDSNLGGVVYSYQWLRVDSDGSSGETEITGEIASTYTLTAADAGKKVKVKVSFTDDLNGDEERTSAAYPASDTVAQMTTMVSIASGGDVTAEGDDATFTLTFSPAAPAGGLTVNVTVAEVQQRTLESGELPYDFVDAANEGMKTVDVAAGTTSATLTVPTVDDELYEAEAGADNLLTATLATGTGYAVASGSDSAELTLMDGADRPVLAWKTDKVTVTEGVDDNAELVLTLSHPLVQEVIFFLVAVTGTADLSSDYTYPDDGENITFAPGATEATDQAGIVDSPLLEGTEIFTVRVFDDLAQPVTLASDSTITVEILDADTMQLSPSAVSARVVEGGAIRIRIDTLPSGRCLFNGAFFVTVTPSGDTATLTDANAVEQRFGSCITTQTVSFATNEDTDVTANRALSFTVATRAGTDSRITLVTDNVVEVAVIDDDRHATGAPTITGTAQVDQVLTASPGSIADSDGLSGAVYTYTWFRVDGSDEMLITGTTGNSYTVVAADQGNTLKVKASFTDDAGFDEERTSAPTATVIGLNSAPVFSQTAQARGIAENTAAGEDIGAAVTATDAGDTLTYTLGGTDMASFDIVAATGQIRTISGVSYDFEAKDSYTVTVTATDTSNATAVATVTISVTDVDEPPVAPATPAVNAVSGSTTSVSVSWVAPANDGKPDIDSYDVQYRVTGSGAVWSDGGVDVAGTSTTITSLTADTPYEVQVRATNDEGDSGWSTPPGSGRTNAPDNDAPVFSPATVDRSIAENTAAGQNVGAVVEATDDGDTLAYTLGGVDMASFDIVAATGQIRTISGVSYDFEAKDSYTVTVTATDTSSATAEASVTISITDVNEPPDAPAQPTVTAVTGSSTSLTVSWDAPANAGKPDIDSYDVQYRLSGATAWSDGPQTVATTTATITSLTANTLYEVQVRAANHEGDSGWSTPPGSGRTNAQINTAPVFSPATVDRSIAENTAAGVDIGAAVTATDDGDTLTYTLGGAGMASFDIVAATGQIRTKSGVSYDHEATSSYTVTVTATDTSSATAVATVTISVTDVNEPPDAPATPTVNAVSGSTTSLAVSWAAPANDGKPAIDSYDVQYRLGSSGTWSDGPEDVATTTATVTSLVANTLYEARVRATNAEGDSGWSAPPGSGRTNAPDNDAPVFNPSSVSRSIAENTAAGQNVGAVVTATDDGDTLAYTLGGADMASFDIVGTSGQIRTISGVSYDFEAKDSYTVTVTATDTSSATAEASVTISITDVNEPPDAPATPTVSAVPDSTTSLTVSWAAPANAGKPAIASYDVQYRLGSSGTWSDGPEDVATTTATVTSLVANTLYEARVRATNAEGDSGWSAPPGSGRTNSSTNNAPVFNPSNVSREIAENTAAGQNVGAAVTATDADAGDTLRYELGGADAASFDIVGTSGQIRTKTNVSYDFEAKSSYTVTVTASDGTDSAVATVTISVTDADEPPDAPSAISVTAVTDSSTSLTVSWTAPANDGKPDIESYDVQYRLSGATAWTDGPEDVTGTTTTVSGLTADTEYQVQVRAANNEGKSDWSDPPGSGQTNIIMLSTNAPPTAADKTVTTTLNRNYTFLTTDFGFEDADSGAALASVKIVTLPAVGNLALDGTDVTLNQVVTRAEIDAANLKFEPATDASGTGYASFDFKVNDGTDDSVSAYTMTIDVANVTAPGAPTALTATASGQAWIELAWTAPVHAGGRAITGYRIEVSPDGSSSWSELVLVATTTRSTATTYVHKGLNAGATRHYRVSAIDVVGASDPSGSDHATTRTDDQLVSNFNYAGTADNIHLAIQNVVGIFTTGSRDAKLNSIELKLGKFNNRTVAPELKLYVLNLNSSGRATLGEQVATLATPTTSLPRHSFRTFNYEAPSGTRLSASEEYIFVLEPPTIGIILVETTTDPSEDDVKADGWTIDGSGHGLEPFYIGSTRQIVFRVNGTLTPNTAPTAAHNTVTMAEDGRYEFSATDFGFHDTNPADRLVSVRIETLPALGALALDGADVTLNQVVTKTQIDAGDLTFRPAAGGSGNNYARFNFKVNDGTVFSASAYTMRIDVTPTPALTGQIFVDNTAETDYLRTVADNRSSQSFTTGPNRGGYILTSIGVVAQIVGENGVDDFSVAVHNADANGAPVALHTSLIPPGNFPEEVSTIHFHAPSNTRLRPNTTYSIVLGSGRTPSRFRQISATQSNADNASGSGWSIGDALHSRRSAASPWSSPNDGRSVKIVIRGNTASGVANNAPVFSPATVDRSIAENTAAGRNVGAVVTATDADNDPLTYTLGGADMASFDIDEFSGQIRTKAGVSYDHEARPSYTVTVTASDGIATADADVTISVTDVNEPPRAPATPVVSAVAGSNTSLTVTWAAPANAGRPAIDSYDVQYRASGATDWIDGPDHSTTTAVTGLVAYTLHAARVTGLIANTEYEARVRAVNDEGNSGWSTPPGAGRTNTLTNNAPVFSPAIVGRSIAENTAADVDIGLPVTATDDDAGDTLGYTLGGAGAEFFDFVGASGQIRTKADVSYDFEARSSYTVTVTASDGTVSAAAIVTISVIDVAEPPDAPATPEVTPVTGSTTSLAVSWAAPDNDGRPAIDGYDVQYRVGGSGTWTDVPQVVTGTTATITGLTAATDYQVQVRAANAEGDSGWSDPPGAGRTHPLTHIAPMFSSLSQTREIAENTAAGVNVGAAVTATDVNNDTLSYTLGGADAASFEIDRDSGQIRTVSGVSYDHEAKPSYTVTVTASDGAATAVATVTINVTDVAEPPDAPATPIVSAVAGSTPSLSVSWTAPANAGRPPIERYSVQWRVPGATVSRAKAVDAPTTTTIISELLADTEYEVRVNATNDEGQSGFSDPPWVGRTSTTLTNNVPVFNSSNVALSIAENTAAGVDIGAAVTATDADAGDTLTYTLRGADAEFFDIVDTTGQIRTKDNVSYDFEAKASYTVTVRVSDSDATAEASVIISITDVAEPPDAPLTPTVSAVADSTTRLTVSWAAPANAGKPDIDSYDVQYRPSGATAWINGPRNVATTTTTVTGLTANTLYEAQVRATNHEGDSGWSDPPGSGRTNSATTNNAPVFSSSNVTRDIAENTAAGRNVGAAVAATDDDGDTLGYTLGGTDAAFFDFVEATGQIRTKSGVSYDHEAKSSYTVTVTASDGAATAVANVTISITDEDEPPDAPAMPTVSAVSGRATSLSVSWAAPANAGRPAIANYDVQYRASGSGTWTDGPQNVTGTTETISGLVADTEYEVQVRATNDEGDSGWSTPPGAGRTNAPGNNAPVFNPASVSRSIAENTSAGQNVGAAVEATDGDGDTLSYTLGGADKAAFEIDRNSGQIRTISGVSYDHEAKSSYTVTVTASDSSNASADAGVTISVTDVNEPPNAPATPEVLAVASSTTSLTVSWTAPANAGRPAIESYDVRYRAGSSGAWTDGPRNLTGTTATLTSLAADTRYQVQVRAANDEGDSGWSSPPGAGRTNAAAISPPGVVGLTATAAVCDDKPQYRRKQYGCVTLAWEEPVVDSRTVLERMEYRFAESGSELLWSGWQLDGTHSRTGAVIDRLELGTKYVFEVRAVILEGPGPAASTTIETPAAAAATGLISLSVPRQTVIEGGTATFEVRRASDDDDKDPATFVLVGVTDSAFPDISALGGPRGSCAPGEDACGAGGRIVKLRPGETSATGTVKVEFDGARPTSRSLTVTLASVERPHYDFGTPTTLSIKVTDRDAGLRVRDARVREGPGAMLAFAVTLDRKPDHDVAVNYSTSDDTALQGEDYTRTAGALVFAAGERSKTVSVPVLDDVHDEGSETLTLTLSNARGAVIDDATAVGTIVNSDPMPNAWLSRFGRAASDQVVQSIGRRLEGGARESHVTVLGWRADTLFESTHSERDGREPGADAPGGQPDRTVRAPEGRIGAAGVMAGGTRGVGAMSGPGAARPVFEGAMTQGSAPMQGGSFQSPARAAGGLPGNASGHPASAARDNRWLDRMGRLLMSLGPNGGEALATPGLRDMVMGSSFYYGHSPDAGPLRGMNRLTAWGESASTRFSGAEGKLSLDGEVNTAILGADGEWGRWLAGLALSYSEGEGGYRQASAKGGAVSSTLSGINPYARYRLDERTSLWGTLGYGSGRLTLTPDGAESALETDMTNAMAAFGGRGVLSMRRGETGRFELAVRTDAMLTDTASMAVAGLSGGEGATSRIRLILEGSGSLPAFGGVLAPKVEAGLRYDGGDAETGAGLEVGGGLAYDMARLTVQVDGRVLLTHRDRDYEEWGYSVSFVYQPASDGRGLRYQAGSQWGATQSGVQSLWSLQNASGLASGARTPNGQRYTAELGYGFGVGRLWYPYVATESGGASSQALRFGLKLNAASGLDAGLEIGRLADLSGQIENDIRLQWQARW